MNRLDLARLGDFLPQFGVEVFELKLLHHPGNTFNFAVAVKDKATVSYCWNHYQFQVNFLCQESPLNFKSAESALDLISCRAKHVIENNFLVFNTSLVLLHAERC